MNAAILTPLHLIPAALLAAFGFTVQLRAQADTDFSVHLRFDYASAEQALELYNDNLFNTGQLAELRASRIAASTTGMIAGRGGSVNSLKACLDSLRFHQQIHDDIFRLEEARENKDKIAELLDALKKRNVSRRIEATVAQIFPADARVNVTIPVYVVAFGHENVDAYVRRVVWHGNTPVFVGEQEGELTIVINLAHTVRYSPTVDEQFISIVSVVAHEVFHAAFGAYKDLSSSWKRYYRTYTRPFDQLVDLVHNEGIAYYLSLEQQSGGRLPPDWVVRMRDAFDVFNSNSREILNPSTSQKRIREIIRSANLSGYWESYGSMVGMHIAREIDRGLGRPALIETIGRNCWDFLQKYADLTTIDSNLPKLDPLILSEIPRK